MHAAQGLQSTQEGLLRFIRYEFLSDDPRLIRQIVCERWVELVQALGIDHPLASNSWSLSILKDTLAGLPKASSKHVL